MNDMRFEIDKSSARAPYPTTVYVKEEQKEDPMRFIAHYSHINAARNVSSTCFINSGIPTHVIETQPSGGLDNGGAVVTARLKRDERIAAARTTGLATEGEIGAPQRDDVPITS